VQGQVRPDNGDGHLTAQLLRFGDTIGPGEERTAQQLAAQLPADWTIICNKVVWNDFGASREIDLVVVGRHGVYVLDEKSWAGAVTADEGHWTLPSGDEIPSPVSKIEVTAKGLAVQMKQTIPGLQEALGGRFFLWGYVLFSSPKASLVTRNDSLRGRVLQLGEAAKVLMSLDASRAGNPADIEAFRADIIDWFGHPPDLAAMPEAQAHRGSGHRRWVLVGIGVAVALLVAVAVVWAAFGGGGDAPIPWQEASQNVGKSVRVQGPVVRSDDGFKYVFLNVGEPYVKGQASGFAVWLDFKSLGESAADVEAAYPEGTVVTVEGVIGTDDDGRPKIVVTDPSAITSE